MLAALALIPALILTLSRTASAAASAPAALGWLSLGILSGAMDFDPHLADYQWDITPRAAWGAQALVGRGRMSAGLRVWRASTTQHMDYANVLNPAVRATTFDVVGRGRLASVWRFDVEACASAGRIQLGYSPDRVVISASGGGPPTEVSLKPIHEWSTGLGIAVKRPLMGPWSASIDMEHQGFGMLTAHRAGGSVVVGRESFGEWSARFELARVVGRR